MGPTRINTILQSAFFKLTNIIPEERAIQLMKEAAQRQPMVVRVRTLLRRTGLLSMLVQPALLRYSGSGKLEELRG